MSDTSRELLAKYREGSDDAADRIFQRYLLRLTALARVRLSERIARRIDPEDVVLSAYRSFFVGACDGRFELESAGDLWRLLVAITLHKLHRQVAAHQAAKRDATNEAPMSLLDAIAARDPTPEEVLSVSDELESILQQLSPTARRVIELRLQGMNIQQIAHEIARNERTVRRILEEARKVFQSRFQLDDAGSSSNAKDPNFKTDLEPCGKDPRIEQRRETPIRILITFPEHLKRLLYGDYLLQRFAGSGGSGKVYQAIERATGRKVAVKFLRKSFQIHRDHVQRFVDEASIVARMKHPGIAPMYGLGQSPQGGFFMVSEWYPKGDLGQRMRLGSIDPAAAAKWVHQVALAMQHVHERGLVHCDLKPSNLLIDDHGQVVVTDFGLARSVSVDGSLSVEGTAGYMALEQALPGSGRLGPRTDVFGLGAVLYALLAGHPPYNGNRPSEILARLLANHPIVPLSSKRPDVPRSLEELCFQCLNRNPQDRPGTAGELAERLNAVIVKL